LATDPVAAPGATPDPILVVEDDGDLRELLRRMLEREGFAVTTAAHGRDALERFHERPARLVLTDIQMPEMDGMELIRRLLLEHPRLPIIAISGAENWGLNLRIAMHAGARAAISKPVSSAQLLRQVWRILAEPEAPAAAPGTLH
jgi:CheY-like chemotaxis protein